MNLPDNSRSPRRWPLVLAAGAVLLGAGALATLIGVVAQRAGAQATTALKLFTLHDADGRIVTGRNHPGDLLLLYFGYTYCPDACPTTLGYLARVMKALTPDEAARIQVAFVSIDPQRDTPPRLREYLSVFDPRFIALGGSTDEIAEAARAFEVIYRRTPARAGPDTYGFDHTDLVYVLDGHGRQVVMLGTHLPEEEALRRLRQHLIPSGQGLCCRAPSSVAARLRMMNGPSITSSTAAPALTSLSPPTTPTENP